MLIDQNGGTITLSEADGIAAQLSRMALSRVELASIPPYLHFAELPDDITIPKAAIPLIAQMLDAISRGEPIHFLSESRELTPQEAAGMLGISRPLLMHIIKKNVIPHRRVGSHYRLALKDILTYQAEQQRREQILQTLVTEAQEMNMGY